MHGRPVPKKAAQRYNRLFRRRAPMRVTTIDADAVLIVCASILAQQAYSRRSGNAVDLLRDSRRLHCACCKRSAVLSNDQR